MSSPLKTTRPSSAVQPASKPSRADRLAKWQRMVDELAVDLNGVEPPIDSFADPDPSETRARLKPDTLK